MVGRGGGGEKNCSGLGVGWKIKWREGTRELIGGHGVASLWSLKMSLKRYKY